MRAGVVAVCVVLGLQVPTPALEDPDAGAFTPFQAGAQGGIVVPVTVDGQGPFHFLLDTGSTHSSISDAVADAVGAPAVARATVSSAIGGGVRTVVRLGRLQLGPIVATGVMPSVMRLDGIDSERTIDGVIGQDVLAPLRYAIDFRNRRLVWLGDAAALEDGGSTFTLEPTNGRFVVRLPQQASVLRLVPDSGAGALLLFDGDERPLPPMTAARAGAALLTMTARRRVREAIVRELRVGTTTLRNVPAVLVERPAASTHAQERDGDGLLPLHLFERVTFDGPRGRLIVHGRRS